MSGKMLAYIKEQPGLIEALLHERQAIAAPFLRSFGSFKPGRIIMLGSGSSHYACKMALPAAEALLGVEATACPPTQIPPLPLLDMQNTLFFAVSQGGSSSSTVEAVKAIRAAGGQAVTLTGSEGNYVAKAGDLNILLRCGEETIGPKTKGLLASTLTLILLFTAWGQALGTAPEALCQSLTTGMAKAAAQMPENISRCVAWCESVMQSLAPAQHIAILAEGYDLYPALECAMKLLETICRPVIAYELEEYLHGCFCMLNEKSTMLFLLPQEEAAAARFHTLRRYCEGKGAHCLLISRGAGSSAQQGLDLTSTGNPMLSFLEYLLPGQVLSALMSGYVGIDIEAGVLRDFSKAIPFHEGEPRPWSKA